MCQTSSTPTLKPKVLTTFDYKWFNLDRLEELINTVKLPLPIADGVTLCTGHAHYITLIDPDTGYETWGSSINTQYSSIRYDKETMCDIVRTAKNCIVHVTWDIDPNMSHHIDFKFIHAHLTADGLIRVFISCTEVDPNGHSKCNNNMTLSYNTLLTKDQLSKLQKPNLKITSISGQFRLTETLIMGG